MHAQLAAWANFFSCLEKAKPSSQETWLHSLGYYSSFFQAQSSIFDDLSSAFWQGNEILCGLFFSVKTFTRGGVVSLTDLCYLERNRL